MFKKFSVYSAICCLFWVIPSLADQLQPEKVATLVLENGARVQLNDDFTWEYVFVKSASEVSGQATKSAALATEEAVEKPAAGSATELSAPSVSLSSAAIAQADLLKSTAKNGVKVSLLSSQWDAQDRLGLNFELVNTGSKNYVQVALAVSLFADSGDLLSKQELKVWQAIFRLPESYLRKGQTRNSDTIWLEGVDKAQWQKQLLTLKITEMDSR
ncbi:DUF3157 family protein [Agarivorans sp. QJM3NY_25]|uniref:DUF3157 family protein n=1 Tax=Agarivorans sp. QJM3NY_25 TaxID=3421430 RepID=UPI003D7C5EFF